MCLASRPGKLEAMTKDRTSAGEAPTDEGMEFRIVLAFEDSASAQSARTLCERLTSRLGGELRFIQRSWNLQSTAEEEFADGAPALAWPDMIILAMHRADQRVPPAFCEYLEHLARRRHRRAAAVVALFDDAMAPSSSGVAGALEELRAAASHGRFALFVRGAGTTPATTGRGGDITPVPRIDFYQDVRPPARPHWGLNE